MNEQALQVYLGPELAAYGFGAGHPFHNRRHQAFERAFDEQGLRARCSVRSPVLADESELLRFHDRDHVDRVRSLSAEGAGILDQGDTPAVRGIFEAACAVVGSTLDATKRIAAGEFSRAFVPIAGLHHARRDRAAGFCVFNDCGVAIEWLLRVGNLERIAYVDIDAHHGDGVYYGFEHEPRLIFADFHQDGRTLYPGTGDVAETGKGAARGFKINVPLPPGADDAMFAKLWPPIEAFIDRQAPQMILLQCGADSLAGDPLAGLRLSAVAHRHTATRLRVLAERHCGGRLLAMGGGGYDMVNIGAAWTAVVEALI